MEGWGRRIGTRYDRESRVGCRRSDGEQRLQPGMEGSGESERMQLGFLLPKTEKPGTKGQPKNKRRVGQVWFGDGRQSV